MASLSLDTQDLIHAIDTLGIGGADICIHASMKSFGAPLQCGIPGIIDAFLQKGCTILVPSFSDQFEVAPIRKYMPPQNGTGDDSYFFQKIDTPMPSFDPCCKEISVEEMGIFAKSVLEDARSVRGNHPLNSFTALGSHARALVRHQTPRDVYAPLRQLCAEDGYILLMGVGLNRATILHYAEQLAGRNPFIRWALAPNGAVMPVSAGGCSEGFACFEPVLRSHARTMRIADSEWQCYKATEMVAACVAALRSHPSMTHCADMHCDRCNDALLGGPILSDDFWVPCH